MIGFHVPTPWERRLSSLAREGRRQKRGENDVPTPWERRLNYLTRECIHFFWVLGYFCSCLYSIDTQVSGSRTAYVKCLGKTLASSGCGKVGVSVGVTVAI
jgi:hypothetical protein